jgi:hypothetical protein
MGVDCLYRWIMSIRQEYADMGKKTLYHPISVTIIRGALEFCGVKPGRLTQRWSDLSIATAEYSLDIQRLPHDMDRLDATGLHRALAGCFAADITVMDCTVSYNPIKRNKRITVILRCVAALPVHPIDFADLDDVDIFDRPSEIEAIE